MKKRHNIDKLLVEVFQKLDQAKDANKIYISKSIQTGGGQRVQSNLELVDTLDLSRMFIINNSPLLKDNIRFTMKVLGTTIKGNRTVVEENDVDRITQKINTETYNILDHLYKEL